ncbi:hypothetical protein ACH42_01185 [Endozoicomonas sp. (ex Bugula neritina AB1)]|nr:hypothetical protein ACH42_01185 [Endozoicomonas sp. (ex Bugula neritina AB1)]
MSKLIVRIEEAIDNQRGVRLAFSNPEFLLEANVNEALREYLNACTYNVPDGIGVLWVEWLKYGFSGRLKRVTGTDFTHCILDLASRRGFSVFFLGGTAEVANDVSVKLEAAYPMLEVLGVEHGYYDAAEEARIVERILNCKPDILMVCKGNPMQEQWIANNLPSDWGGVVLGNGGAMDFLSGRVARAPHMLRKFGLEWLFRLSQDFSRKRLRRQLRLLFVFPYLVMKFLVGGNAG